MEVIAALGLAGLGALVNEMKKKEDGNGKKSNDDEWVGFEPPETDPPPERKACPLKCEGEDSCPYEVKERKPSSKNIYDNRYSERVFNNEFERSKRSYERAYKDDLLVKDWPELNWEERHYNKTDKLVQLERDIKNPHPWTTTKLPISTINEIQKTAAVKSYDLEKEAKNQTRESFNCRRNRMIDPTFTKIAEDSDGRPIFKTNYKNGKDVTVYTKGHNNMEPFIGKGVNQNLNPMANRTTLEHFTGTMPVYKHKKEVKRFFPLVKDPFAVGGLPSSANRESDRYIPSISHQNTLPFNQVRENPGLNQDPLQVATNIGFHDPYRPLGRGVFKDVDQIRVNPKSVYKGRMVGEGHYIPYGVTKTAPVITRRHKNIMFTNFAPGTTPEMKKEGYTNNIETCDTSNYVRQMLPIKAEVDKGEIFDDDTIVLRENTRAFTGARIENYPTHSYHVTRNQTYNFDKAKDTIKQQTEVNEHDMINLKDETRRGVTQFFDKAKDTIKQQTEVNEHDKINPNDENRRGVTQFFDKAKETIRQQTEVNEHDMINAKDENRRGTTYYFDKAKETIREQTEDNKHSKINPQDENRRGVTYFFDKAKETIREQTEDHQNSKINPEGTSRFRLQDITGFLNASINAIREFAIPKNRAPTSVGVQNVPDKEKIGKYDIFRRQQFSTYKYQNSVDPSVEASRNSAAKQIGDLTQHYPEYVREPRILSERHDPYVVQAYKENPYTQSLQSWQIPHNPKYPSHKVASQRIFVPPKTLPMGRCENE